MPTWRPRSCSSTRLPADNTEMRLRPRAGQKWVCILIFGEHHHPAACPGPVRRAHYNRQRPHRALQLRPPPPRSSRPGSPPGSESCRHSRYPSDRTCVEENRMAHPSTPAEGRDVLAADRDDAADRRDLISDDRDEAADQRDYLTGDRDAEDLRAAHDLADRYQQLRQHILDHFARIENTRSSRPVGPTSVRARPAPSPRHRTTTLRRGQPVGHLPPAQRTRRRAFRRVGLDDRAEHAAHDRFGSRAGADHAPCLHYASPTRDCDAAGATKSGTPA